MVVWSFWISHGRCWLSFHVPFMYIPFISVSFACMLYILSEKMRMKLKNLAKFSNLSLRLSVSPLIYWGGNLRANREIMLRLGSWYNTKFTWPPWNWREDSEHSLIKYSIFTWKISQPAHWMTDTWALATRVHTHFLQFWRTLSELPFDVLRWISPAYICLCECLIFL